MNNILKAWTASFVRRWHTQQQLCDTHDPVSGHQQRSTLLLILFWPSSSRAAIIDCLIHDQGEDDGGDMARPAKQRFPEIRDMLEVVEGESIILQGFPRLGLSTVELKRRKWVDLLDSYIWMLRHKPHLRKRPEWIGQLQALHEGAMDLEAYGFDVFIQEANAYFTSEE